jgi:hypothetical protein
MFKIHTNKTVSWDRLLSMGLDYGLEDRGSIPGRGNDEIFFLRHRVRTDSEAHPASYSMGIGDFIHGGKAAGGLKLITHLQLASRLRMREAVPPLPYISSWRGA